MSIKHVIGIISYVGKTSSEQRIAKIKESLPTLEKLKTKDNFVFIWDNDSTEEHKSFLKANCKFVDKIYFSSKNLYDLGSLNCLSEVSKKLEAKYVTYVEDDMVLFDPDVFDASYEFLENNVDCGYVRLAKFEYEKIENYDKMKVTKETDFSHSQRMFNSITKESLKWEKAGEYKGYSFYKNNWHWNLYPSVCRNEVFQRLTVREDSKPLMGVEKKMMELYHKLNLKTGILNGGAFAHNQPDYTPVYSARVQDKIQNVVLYEEVQNEIKKVVNV